MNTLLKTTAILGLTMVVFAGFENSASASDACVKIGDQFFLNGVLVEKSKCGSSARAMKHVSSWTGTHTDECTGKPKGHTFLKLGPDGKRLAQYRCR